jgi:hypothetical protein
VSDIETMIRAQAETDNRAAPSVTSAEARARAGAGTVEVAALVPSAPPRRTPGRLAAAAVVLVVLAIGLATVVSLGTSARRGARPATSNPPRSEMPIGWSAIPVVPFANRSAPLQVWTGRDLLVVGGYTVHNELADGGAFDPSTRTWTVVPSGPFAFGQNDAFAVWDGHELLVWQTVTTRSNPALLGAAYNPSTRTWRGIASNPLPARTAAPTSQVAVWAGSEVLAWSADPSDGLAPGSKHVQRSAVYDPIADSWHTIYPAPIGATDATAVWTGTEVEFFGWISDHVFPVVVPVPTQDPVVAYSPADGTWQFPRTRFPYSQLEPVAATWTGGETIVWGAKSDAYAYDPARREWARLPKVPITSGECYPQAAAAGNAAFAYACGLAALLDPVTHQWQRVATPLRALEANQKTYTTGPTSAGTGIAFWNAGAPSTQPQGWWYQPAHQ